MPAEFSWAGGLNLRAVLRQSRWPAMSVLPGRSAACSAPTWLSSHGAMSTHLIIHPRLVLGPLPTETFPVQFPSKFIYQAEVPNPYSLNSAISIPLAVDFLGTITRRIPSGHQSQIFVLAI